MLRILILVYKFRVKFVYVPNLMYLNKFFFPGHCTQFKSEFTLNFWFRDVPRSTSTLIIQDLGSLANILLG